MDEPWGYREENEYVSNTSRYLADLEEFFANAKYNKEDNKIHFYNKDGEEREGSAIDVAEFEQTAIVEDAYYDKDTKEVVIEFTNGDIVRIDAKDLLDINEFKDGLEVDEDGVVRVKLVDGDGTENYLTVDEEGISAHLLDIVIQDIYAKIAEEIARAIAAEEALDQKIEDETARATSAETALDNKIDAEVSRSTEMDEEHDRQLNVIDQRVGLLEVQLPAEVSRAKARENELDAKIDNETARATSAETALDNKIDAETARATAAETAIDNKLDNEIARATSAETELNDKVDSEVSRATSAETAIDNKVETEIARATSAETELNDKVDTEIARASSAETAIDNKLDNEIARATSAETAIDNKVDAEASRATSAESMINETAVFNAEYDSSAKTINFYNKDGDVVASIDASDFLIDGMVDNVEIKTVNDVKYLAITFNAQSGKEEIDIPLSDIFNPDNYYTKGDIDTKLDGKANAVHEHDLSAITDIKEFGNTGIIVTEGTDNIVIPGVEF